MCLVYGENYFLKKYQNHRVFFFRSPFLVSVDDTCRYGWSHVRFLVTNIVDIFLISLKCLASQPLTTLSLGRVLTIFLFVQRSLQPGGHTPKAKPIINKGINWKVKRKNVHLIKFELISVNNMTLPLGKNQSSISCEQVL